MNKTKIFGIIALCFFLLNLSLIFLLFSNNPTHPKRKQPREIIIRELDFNAAQIKQYDWLIHQHRKQMRTANHQLMRVKNTLYNTLKVENTTLKVDSLFVDLEKVHLKIEKINYHHFQQIKAICYPNQLDKFKRLTSKIARLFAPPPMNKRK